MDALRSNRLLVAAGAVAAAATVARILYRTTSGLDDGNGTSVLPDAVPNKQRVMFIFGLGFTGARLAKAMVAEGWTVIGTCRSEGSAAKHRLDGVHTVVWDSINGDDHPSVDVLLIALEQATHILITAAPGVGTVADSALKSAKIRRALANNLDTALRVKWVGYLSTVGVYGNRDGQEASEASIVNPSSARGIRRVKACLSCFRVVSHNASTLCNVIAPHGICTP